MDKHSICHVEWQVTDLQKAQKFFGGLFGWSFEAMGDSYVLFKPPSEPGGGLMKEQKAGSAACAYVLVDEIEPYLDKAKQLGGEVKVPKTPIPGHGWFALLNDPDGNVVGIFESGDNPG